MDEEMNLEERIAEFFHETYERLAPQYSYTTRKESAVPWSKVPPQNKQLMIAVSREVIKVFGLEAAITEQTGLWLTTANTADILVFWQGKLLLVKRNNEPYKDMWAFPGGFFEPDKGETLQETAIRELGEEAGVYCIGTDDINIVGSYSKPKRDPRGPVITTAYSVVIDNFYPDYDGEIQASDDVSEVGWFELDELPPLAFDHEKILDDYLW